MAFYFEMNDGSHRPLSRGKRPLGVTRKVFLDEDAGETPNKLWVKKTVTITTTKDVYVHPDKADEALSGQVEDGDFEELSE